VIYYDLCRPALDLVNAFMREREMGRLVTVTAEGLAHIGLYPFTYEGNTIEVHLNQKDEQIADLKTCPRCIFEVDEVLGVIPSGLPVLARCVDAEGKARRASDRRRPSRACEVVHSVVASRERGCA
jgi:nitroimidazol reductase NimA-like FMN-containing flavoprotein (pyridoxamine 5'-phosphate oxidase superfamily)